eukprot:scpid31137/ scgid5547/ 
MSWKPPSGRPPMASSSGKKATTSSHVRRPSWNAGSASSAFASAHSASTDASTLRTTRVRSSSLERRRSMPSSVASSSSSVSDLNRRSNTEQALPRGRDATVKNTVSSSRRSSSNVRSGERHGVPAAIRSTSDITLALSQGQAPHGRVTSSTNVSSNRQATQHHAAAVKAKHDTYRQTPSFAAAHSKTAQAKPLRHGSTAVSAARDDDVRFPAYPASGSKEERGKETAVRANPHTAKSWDGTMEGQDTDRGGWLFQQDTSPAEQYSTVDDEHDYNSPASSQAASQPLPSGSRSSQRNAHTMPFTADDGCFDSLAGHRSTHARSILTQTIPVNDTSELDSSHRQPTLSKSKQLPGDHHHTNVTHHTTGKSHQHDGQRFDSAHSTVHQHTRSSHKSTALPSSSSASFTGHGRSAQIAELEKEVKDLREENSNLAQELEKFRSLYQAMTSASSSSASDHNADTNPTHGYRRSNLLKAQIFQLERQVLLLSTALSKRASLVQETFNTIEQVMNLLSHYQAESVKKTSDSSSSSSPRSAAASSHNVSTATRNGSDGHKPRGVFIPRREFDDMLHSVCHTHARIAKGFEMGTTPELENALVFMSPFLKGSKSTHRPNSVAKHRSAHVDICRDGNDGSDKTQRSNSKASSNSNFVQPRIIDVCSGSLQHLNLRHVGHLEGELYQLYGHLQQLLISLQTTYTVPCIHCQETPPATQLQSSSSASLLLPQPTPQGCQTLERLGRARSARAKGGSAPSPRLLNDETAQPHSNFKLDTTLEPTPDLVSSGNQGRKCMVDGGHRHTMALASPFVHTHAVEHLNTACSRLDVVCKHLLELCLLVPAAPFAALDRQELPIEDWSNEAILAQLPPNMRNRKELCSHLDALVKAVKYTLAMKDQEVSGTHSELQFYQRCQELNNDYVYAYLDKIRDLLVAYEDQLSASLGVSLTVVLEAYETLKTVPSEESLRTFVSTFKDNANVLSEGLDTLQAAGSSGTCITLLSHSEPSINLQCVKSTVTTCAERNGYTADLSALMTNFTAAVSTMQKEHTALWSKHAAATAANPS